MELSAGQLKAFDDQGYVFFPNCFSENEIVLLRAEAESILKLDRQEVWRVDTGALVQAREVEELLRWCSDRLFGRAVKRHGTSLG